ncbi:MAG: hypothetical protein HY717_00560 [Planctomycetes bacterium]|nr:hypothetical protein [Planctomycetota bacterium]
MRSIFSRLVPLILGVFPWLGRLPAQLAPEQALASMKAAPGLQVALFAAEPQVINPTCIDLDPQGRIWVCEGVNYRGKASPPFRRTGDRIVILEDADGDGRCDRSTVFYESPDFQAPIGICYLGDRLLVSQSPRIWSIRINPDGTAGERKDFLAGFGGVNHDHGVHSLVLGPDGLLYGAVGNGGAQVTGADGRRLASDGKPLLGGLVFRCRLDGGGLEALAHNFRNNYECALNSFGDIFQSDNDDDGNQWVRFVHIFPGGDYGYVSKTGRSWAEEKKSHWRMEDPGVVPILARTGAGSPTGLCVYEGNLLPEMYRGMPIHCDAGPRVVQCFRLKPLGAAYHVEEVPLDPAGRQTVENLSAIVRPHVLLASSDAWFRPSDVAAAPDGSLFVSDWYDPGVGGHGMGDTSRGRIYRLAPAGRSGYHAAPFDLQSDAGLLQALASPALSSRGLAARRIQELGRKALPALRRALDSGDPILAARAAWLLGALGEKEILARLAALPDPRFQVLALRCARLFFESSFLELASPLASSRDWHVRRELLLQLRGFPGEAALKWIARLAGEYDGFDRFYLEAIGIASQGREGQVFQALSASWGGEWNKKVKDLLWELHPPEAAEFLARRLASPSIPDAEREEIAAVLPQLPGEAGGRELLKLLLGEGPANLKGRLAALLASGLEERWRFLRKRDDSRGQLEAAAAALLKVPGLEAEGAQLAASGRLLGLKAEIAVLALREGTALEARQAAVDALASFNDPADAALLERLAGRSGDLAGRAIAALGRMSGSAPQEALRRLILESRSSDARAEAVRALGMSRSGGLLLLQMARNDEIPEALKSLAGTLVQSSAYEEVRLLGEKLFPRPRSREAEALPPVAELVKRQGSAGRGKRVFFDQNRGNCGRCHRVKKQGSDVGPDLSAIGVKLGKEGLYEAILSPSAAISFEYKPWILETRSAGLVTGYIVGETDEQVTLKDANGSKLPFRKQDILSRSPSDISLMPEGLVGSMNAGDLVDLVEFLGLLKPLEGGGRWLEIKEWMLAGPFANAEDRGLDEEYPPEKGVRLDGRYQGRDGAVGWRKVKADEEGYVDLTRELMGSDRSVTYFFAALQSPKDQEAEVHLGSDDGVKVWLNGNLAHANHVHRAASPDQDSFRVRLKAGRNELLVKVDNGDGPTGLYFTIEAEEAVKPEL